MIAPGDQLLQISRQEYRWCIICHRCPFLSSQGLVGESHSNVSSCFSALTRRLDCRLRVMPIILIPVFRLLCASLNGIDWSATAWLVPPGPGPPIPWLLRLVPPSRHPPTGISRMCTSPSTSVPTRWPPLIPQLCTSPRWWESGLLSHSHTRTLERQVLGPRMNRT